MSSPTNWKKDHPEPQHHWDHHWYDDDSAVAVLDSEFEDENDSLEAEFKELAERWQKETADISSIAKVVLHEAYQKIIGFGPPVLPLLLRELRTQPDLWFDALNAITRDNPVRREDRGNVDAMAAAWLQWGEDHGYGR